MVNKDTLKGIYLFKDLDPAQIEKIAQICVTNEFTAGQEIFFTGQAAEAFYVIQQGGVKIFSTTSKGDEIEITRLGSGSHFGEIPFLTKDSRTATAQATEPCYLVEIPYSKLSDLLKSDVQISDKVHRALAGFLATRLKATTQNLSTAKETMLRHF
jgi:CRP-like cAMP-binding protein